MSSCKFKRDDLGERDMKDFEIKSDAIGIWKAGVAAVDGSRLVEEAVRVDGRELQVGNKRYDTEDFDRLIVVGFGKASAAMAVGLERALGEHLSEWSIESQINVPDDCVIETKKLNVEACRPRGENLPTEEVVVATRRIVELIGSASGNDVVICLISGGGSALLEMPVEPLTLKELRETTSFLSGHGADIYELNAVRRLVSQVKGGGLAAISRAQVIALILSDVVGDPIEVIASGPTMGSTSELYASDVLAKFDPTRENISENVWSVVESTEQHVKSHSIESEAGEMTNLVIGNIDTAMNAAAEKARELGYAVDGCEANGSEGDVDSVGRKIPGSVSELLNRGGKRCLIRGGETTVRLCDTPGLGGRNQHLVLAALDQFLDSAIPAGKFCLLSGGTDGEDGTSAAAGAMITLSDVERMRSSREAVQQSLASCDSHRFHESQQTTLTVGRTWTNVCDLRILLVNG